MDWYRYLTFFKSSTFVKIKQTIENDPNNIFPPKHLILKSFNECPLGNLKVIIIGQDPYHGQGEANGLCFSVNECVKTPPSLRNIFLELKSDIGVERRSTDLLDWARQGVLLLNRTLTVYRKQANSHKDIGWHYLTNEVIKIINEHKQNCVFILWGRNAQELIQYIDKSKHHIIKSAHPSPFSANNGFFGSKPFSQCNDILIKTNQESIKWG